MDGEAFEDGVFDDTEENTEKTHVALLKFTAAYKNLQVEQCLKILGDCPTVIVALDASTFKTLSAEVSRLRIDRAKLARECEAYSNGIAGNKKVDICSARDCAATLSASIEAITINKYINLTEGQCDTLRKYANLVLRYLGAV